MKRNYKFNYDDNALNLWSAQEVETLRSLWGPETASEIARQIGRSRNAVIGKAARMNLPMTERAVRPYPSQKTHKRKMKNISVDRRYASSL